MPVPILVVPTDNVDDVTSASIFVEMQKPVDTLNSHMTGLTTNGATRQTDAMIDATALPETTTPTQTPGTQHDYNDGTYHALSTFLGAFSGTGAIAKLAAAAAAKTYFAALALLASHGHADAATGGQLLAANTHQSPDTDGAPTSLHHTLGTGANQAAAGNHTHAALYAPLTGGGTSGTWPISVSGNAATATTATTAGTAGAATTATTATAVNAGAIVTASITDGAVTSNKLAIGGVNQDRLSSLYASPATGGGNALKVAVIAGNPWNGNVFVQFAGSNSPPIDPTGITGGNSRIDLLVINAAGSLAWSQGTPKASPLLSDPLLPSAAVPVWYAKVYAGATSVTGYQDLGHDAFLYADARAVFLNPTGQGASAASAPISSTYVTDADETASLANAKRLGAILAGLATVSVPTGITGPVGGAPLVRTGYRTSSDYDAHLGNMLRSGATPSLASAITKATTTTMQVAASSGTPVALDITGAWRVATATVTSPVATGAAGIRYLFADASGVGPGFALAVSSSATPGANQRLIATFWWDGTAIRDDQFIDITAATGTAPSSTLTMQTISITGSGSPTITGNNNWQLGALGVTTFYLPKASHLLVFHAVQASAVTAATNTQAGVSYDAALGFASIAIPGATGANGFTGGFGMDMLSLAAGSHTITQGIYVTTGNSLTLVGGTCFLRAIILN